MKQGAKMPNPNTLYHADALTVLEWAGWKKNMSKLRKPCEHWAVGYVGGKSMIVRLEYLRLYCVSSARTQWVGLGDPPEKEIQKVLKEFRKFKYCPKCGVKLNFDAIAARRVQKEKENLLQFT